MHYKVMPLLATALLIIATPVMADENLIAKVNVAVDYCINEVHKSRVSGYPENYFTEFDAYYNPASGRVENNTVNDNGPALYIFDKCMAKAGFPLK